MTKADIAERIYSELGFKAKSTVPTVIKKVAVPAKVAEKSKK